MEDLEAPGIPTLVVAEEDTTDAQGDHSVCAAGLQIPASSNNHLPLIFPLFLTLTDRGIRGKFDMRIFD